MKLRWLIPVFFIARLATASVTVTVNGTNYTIPQNNEKGWGTAVTSWIQAITSNTLQPNTSSFTLSSELDLGGTAGVKSLWFKSRSLNAAGSGVFRLANTDCMSFRNAGNTADLCLTPGASDGLLNYNGVPLVGTSLTQTLTNKTISPGSNTISLASSHILVGNVSAVAADVALSGDASLANTGAITVASVGGSTAANIHSGEVLANAATSLNTASQIVERAADGSFASGTITVGSEQLNSTGLNSSVASGGTAHIFNSSNTFSSGKLLSIQNNGAEKFYVDMNGGGLMSGNVTINGSLSTGSNIKPAGTVPAVITYTTSSTVSVVTDTIYADATSGALTLTLPAATTGNLYRIVKIDSSANTVTISRAGADTINGSTSIVLAKQYDSMNIQSDRSTHWYAHAFSGSYTANKPLIGNGTTAPSVGAASGNTTTFATTSGTLTSTHCVKIDASGNLVDSGATCAGSPTAVTLTKLTSTGTTTGYVFTVTAANATAGATYTNNAQTFTVLSTISAGTLLFTSSAGAPTGSGTLTKATGTGDATITFSANSALATYTVPSSPAPLYLKIRMVGGGGGGSGSGTSAGSGGTGGTSYFGANLMSASGGAGGTPSPNIGATGGAASLGTGPVGIAVQGASTTAAFSSAGAPGTNGASTPFGGGGVGSASSSFSAGAGATNSGSGGGGAGSAATNVIGTGGAASGYVDAIITSPAASYVYAIGSGGAGGTAGTSGASGGPGASGQTLIEEHYQ